MQCPEIFWTSGLRFYFYLKAYSSALHSFKPSTVALLARP
jgi:hypothetical protein